MTFTFATHLCMEMSGKVLREIVQTLFVPGLAVSITSFLTPYLGLMATHLESLFHAVLSRDCAEDQRALAAAGSRCFCPQFKSHLFFCSFWENDNYYFV